MYHQELTAKESRTPPMIRAKIGDSLIDLTTLKPQKDLIEKSFDLEPRQLQRAIETGSFGSRKCSINRCSKSHHVS